VRVNDEGEKIAALFRSFEERCVFLFATRQYARLVSISAPSDASFSENLV
jgi:hypothetical protein